MKILILAGDMGARLAEETSIILKPMVEDQVVPSGSSIELKTGVYGYPTYEQMAHSGEMQYDSVKQLVSYNGCC